MIHRGNNADTLRGLEMKPPFSEMCCATAPAVLEFDQAGNLLRHWGPGPKDPWMDQEHGIHVDHRNNVWLAGGGGEDSQILKYTADGRFVMQVGKKGARVRPGGGGGRIRQLLGDSRGHWEGATLVVETTNFTDRLAVTGGARHSEAMTMTERITRIDPQMINYELRVDDPKTYVAPWTLRLTLTSQPGYQIYEYACHEGNRSVPNSLSGERAYERQAAENASNGLPPPERVFEKVNGDDRGR